VILFHLGFDIWALRYQYIKNEAPSILSSMVNGTRGKKYDFKRYDGVSDELPITYLYLGVDFLGKIVVREMLEITQRALLQAERVSIGHKPGISLFRQRTFMYDK